MNDFELLVDLAKRLMPHTKGAALVVWVEGKTTWDQKRIERIEFGDTCVALYTVSDNFHPGIPLVFTTYHDLLDAVIAGAAR